MIAEQLGQGFARLDAIGPPLLLNARCGLLLMLMRLGGGLALRLIRLLVLNRLRGDRRHLIGIAHGRRIGDRRQRNGLIAASLRLGLRLQIQICFTAGGPGFGYRLREQNADNHQQEASDDAPAVHRAAAGPGGENDPGRARFSPG
jgi:hypothetical protein